MGFKAEQNHTGYVHREFEARANDDLTAGVNE